jgi:hypothetical protein
MTGTISADIDRINDEFTGAVKARLLPAVSTMDVDTLEWLVMEHYQFSRANVGFLEKAVDSTRAFAEPGVSVELRRNADEEDGHAAMYRQAMRDIGTDVDTRAEFAATTAFLSRVDELCAPDPSRALGSLYATETAAIFEHEVFYEISREMCERRGVPFQGSLIKRFHDIHLEDGVEQGHKDGLAAFVDLDQSGDGDGGAPVERPKVRKGALDAIEVMREWWDALLAKASI